MDNWTFGWTLVVVGMGGTLTALGLFALMMGALKTLFPVAVSSPPGTGSAGGTASGKAAGTLQRATGAQDDEGAPC